MRAESYLGRLTVTITAPPQADGEIGEISVEWRISGIRMVESSGDSLSPSHFSHSTERVMAPEYYRHSGKVPLGGLLTTAIAGIGTAISLAFVYAYATNWIPFVYVNVLLTLGLGGIVGILVAKAARGGKLRNPGVVGLVGLISGLVALYVAWGADALARLGWPQEGSALSVFYPRFLWGYIQIFYAKGFWGIGKGNAGMISGIPLAIVWLIEAGIIVGLSTAAAWGDLLTVVFCEACNEWTEIDGDVLRLAPEGGGPILALVDEGTLGDLSTADRASPGAADFLKVGLVWCETCDDCNYLDVERVQITENKKGESKTVTTPVISKLAISREQRDEIRAAGEETRNTVLPKDSPKQDPA